MTNRKMVSLLALAAVCLAGCGGSAKKAAAAPAVVTGSDANSLLAAAQETLERMYFTMDKYDVEAGYLCTRPLRAGQFFEPWRKDNASGLAFGQANLDSLRRTVEVFVEPQGGVMGLRCAVTVEKLSLPPRPVRGTASLAGMYTDSSLRKQSLAMEKDPAGKQTEWIDLGPDLALEQRILKRIQQQLKQG